MHFILLFSLLISLMSSVEAQGNEEEWDEMEWDDVCRVALASESGPQTTEELVSMLEYLDKRPHDIFEQKYLVKTYLEFSQISQSRCYSGFFSYLTESIETARDHGTPRSFDYLIEVETNQFNACKDIWTTDILRAKENLDRRTKVKAKQFLDSFTVQPIPYPKQYFNPNGDELVYNLINGALSFVESQLGKPLESKGRSRSNKKVEIAQKYDKLVKELCVRVEDELKLETEVFMELYNSHNLIPSIGEEALDWIQIEGICRFALETGIDRLAEEAYSIVVQRYEMRSES